MTPEVTTDTKARRAAAKDVTKRPRVDFDTVTRNDDSSQPPTRGLTFLRRARSVFTMQRSTLLFRAAVRNSAERVLVVSLPTLMATACITPLDDPVGGTTDAPESPACFAGENCNGVKLWCRNQNEGADESGGDGGSAPNYWWER